MLKSDWYEWLRRHIITAELYAAMPNCTVMDLSHSLAKALARAVPPAQRGPAFIELHSRLTNMELIDVLCTICREHYTAQHGTTDGW